MVLCQIFDRLSSNISVSSEGIIILQKSLFHIPFYATEVCFLLQKKGSHSDNENQLDN